MHYKTSPLYLKVFNWHSNHNLLLTLPWHRLNVSSRRSETLSCSLWSRQHTELHPAHIGIAWTPVIWYVPLLPPDCRWQEHRSGSTVSTETDRLALVSSWVHSQLTKWTPSRLPLSLCFVCWAPSHYESRPCAFVWRHSSVLYEMLW